jgi:molecular chaperone DnaK (HSP70)
MVLGIDLGTSNTVASTLSRDHVPVLIPDCNNKNSESTPSAILFDGKKALAGQLAQHLYELYPSKKIHRFFKRFFGTSQPVFIDEAGNPWFSETLAAILLKKIQHDASVFMPESFTKMVLTVPAHYNDTQRKSVIEASKLAGMELTAIIDEPIAAALYYSYQVEQIEDEIIMVYDFGGGTFDLTVITKNNNKIFVIAKDGISNIGGKEFDGIVADQIKGSYEQVTRRSFPDDPLIHNRLLNLSEEIKIKLNEKAEGDVSRWLCFQKNIFQCHFSKEEYSHKATILIEKTEKAVLSCLRSLGMSLSDVNKIILIGGTSNSYLVYDYWMRKINPEKQKLIYHQPLASVAKGAALYANSLNNTSAKYESAIQLQTVSTYNIGLKNPENGSIDLMINRNTPLPVTGKIIYKINPSIVHSFSVILCQYWQKDTDLQELGTIHVPHFPLAQNDFLLEVAVENRANGTIAVKVRNADNGQDIRFEFKKAKVQHEFNFVEQQKLLQSIYINAV